MPASPASCYACDRYQSSQGLRTRRSSGEPSARSQVRYRSSLVVTFLEFLRFGLKIAEGFYPDPNHPRIRTLKTAIDLFTQQRYKVPREVCLTYLGSAQDS